MTTPPQPDPFHEGLKNRVEAEIEQMKRVVQDATIEDVETPTGRKDVTIAYADDSGFQIEEGQAQGVYYEPSRQNPYVVHVDWTDDRSRTTVKWDDVETLDESEYYTAESVDDR